MSAGRVQWLLRHVGGTVCRGRPVCWTPPSNSPTCSGRNVASTWRRSFSTEINDDVIRTPEAKTKTRRKQSFICSVGRNIPQKEVQLLGEFGEDLGVMKRYSVIKLIDEKNLKLVLLNGKKDPPLYQLMSGKQIHEEQMKQKNKAKPATTQIKLLTFEAGIAPHDCTTKLKQVESWLKKKHHVNITLQAKINKTLADPKGALQEIVDQINVPVGFVSSPNVVKEGHSAMCILRPPTKKELKEAERSVGPAIKGNQTPPAGKAGAPEESGQQ